MNMIYMLSHYPVTTELDFPASLLLPTCTQSAITHTQPTYKSSWPHPEKNEWMYTHLKDF